MSSELETFSEIQKLVYLIRGQRVMLDSDLARLYGVETKALNQAVKRNIDRFPEDFYFECTINDLDDLRSQIVTAKIENDITAWNYKRRVKPFLFTENGLAMLSGVLHSPRAVKVNIAIMRIFTKLLSYLLMENATDKRVDKLEIEATHVFKTVFERLDDVDHRVKKLEETKPTLAPAGKKIGLK
jgi:hypothetical protein